MRMRERIRSFTTSGTSRTPPAAAGGGCTERSGAGCGFGGFLGACGSVAELDAAAGVGHTRQPGTPRTSTFGPKPLPPLALHPRALPPQLRGGLRAALGSRTSSRGQDAGQAGLVIILRYS